MGMMTRRNVKAREAKANRAPVNETVAKPVEAETKQDDAGEITRGAVMGMNFFSLKSLAKKNGIDVDGKKNDALKAEIIEKMGL